jgi:hypothetical protein
MLTLDRLDRPFDAGRAQSLFDRLSVGLVAIDNRRRFHRSG